tara:strand:+ start:12576 stop:14327 length:1752 start_codon:yes stop_codon:yes gene_type:complete
MIEFKSIKWKNFLSTGNNFTEVNLNGHNRTLIVGENGAGKSTILDALCFSLFSKPFRKINKNQLVNTTNCSDCKVELEFIIGKITWKIIRGIKPNVFEIYKNNGLLDQESAINDQQKWLEQNVLKMNYKSFTQIVVLGSSTFVPFMQLSAPGRRDVIEDILDIRIFSTMNLILKERIKVNKEEVMDVENTMYLLKDKVRVQKTLIEDLKKQSQSNVSHWNESIETLRQDIERSEESLELDMREVDSLTYELEETEDPTDRIQKLRDFKVTFNSKMKDLKKEIKFFSNNTSCPTCHQIIKETLRDEMVTTDESKLSKLNEALDQINSEHTKLNKKLSERNSIHTLIKESQIKIKQLLSDINWKNKKIKEIQKEIESIKTNDDSVDKEKSKLLKIIGQGREKESLKKEVLTKQEDLKMVSEFLKDGGVKSSIIRKYLPVMNDLINKYLQKLEFYVNFNLDEMFNETIKSRFRDDFSYASFSEGEKMRIDLALLFTWREIAKLKNSVNTNILILDEIFDSSLDSNGTQDFMRILYNITDGNNVFVISHKGEQIVDKFNNVIEFKKYKNFSKPKQYDGTTSELATSL